MNKEAISQMPVGLPTHPHDLETLRSTNPAQAMFDNAVFMAEQLSKNVRLTVKNNGEGTHYELTPRERKVDSSNGRHTITIFKASTELLLSAESINGQKKPKEEKKIRPNEALAAKNERHARNRAIFSGIDGKTVYANGQALNVEAGPVNPENRTKSKRNGRGRRNGSR